MKSPILVSGVVVKRSPTGLGLFATQPFKSGTRIIEYFGRELSDAEQYTSRSKYLFGIGKTRMIDGNVKENIARYVNHSCRPNCDTDIKKGKIYIYAWKNIKPGEELTYDYGKEYFNDYFKKGGCKCVKCSKKK